MNYEPKETFKVYAIISKSDFGETLYYLKDVHIERQTEEAAMAWIETEGERQTSYTMLRVFRKG